MKEFKFYIYILSNYNKSVLYIGITNKIARRIIEHQNGFGSSFSKKYYLKFLIYYETYKYVDQAIAREKELKGWKRDKKINLIKSVNPNLNSLNQEIFDSYGINEEEITKYSDYLKNKYKK